MGNYRFRLSDMIPNAWFYKLKDMSNNGRTNSFNKKSTFNSQPRYTYPFTTQPTRTSQTSSINPKFSNTNFLEPPRKSSKKRNQRKTIYKPSPKPIHDHSPPRYDYSNSPFESSSTESDGFYKPHQEEEEEEEFGCCNCRVSSSTTDIILNVNDQSFNKIELHPPPTLTKLNMIRRRSRSERNSSSFSVKIVKEETKVITHKQQPKRGSSSSNSVGIRLRTNSPKIASKKIQPRKSLSSSSSRNKTLSASFAVVKSSIDPQKDFKESMVEMIMENNIRGSKELEDLLACYLSLNSKEYHHLIVKAFEQIWFDMTHLRL
ncbi:transcription repressor OFP2-like [Mercurialis annua]|uniref:transcription repressor OFP2-like n=1 Tax=Mercurialis annua TaxID=3986 RepID=UPI0021610031|nr:transcription repressor OFP2-like [Mercurialis annua]